METKVKLFDKLFDKERVNTKRQIEVDLVKGFTVILIVLCHVGLYLYNNKGTALYTFSDIIGSEFCAPIFMMAMGIGVVYSKHQEPKFLLIRGIKLFIGGYLLNACRTLLPRLIFGNIDDWTTIASFFVVDILIFAGLTFMFLALLKKLKVPFYGVLILSIIMVIADQIIFTTFSLPVQNPTNDVEVASYFLNLIYPLTSWSCFPFLTWFFFPAVGISLGKLSMHLKNKKLFYKILLPISLLVVLYVYYQFYKLYPNYTDYYAGKNFYYMGIKNVILNVFFMIFALSFWYLLSDILPKFIKTYLLFLGKNLTVYYVFTWIFIGFTIHLNTYFGWTYSTLTTILVMLGVIVVCSLCTLLYLYIKKRIKDKKLNSVKA